MNIFECLEIITSHKLETNDEDYIDIRLSRYQAKELVDLLHRINAWSEQMQKPKELDGGTKE